MTHAMTRGVTVSVTIKSAHAVYSGEGFRTKPKPDGPADPAPRALNYLDGEPPTSPCAGARAPPTRDPTTPRLHPAWGLTRRSMASASCLPPSPTPPSREGPPMACRHVPGGRRTPAADLLRSSMAGNDIFQQPRPSPLSPRGRWRRSQRWSQWRSQRRALLLYSNSIKGPGPARGPVELAPLAPGASY